MIASSIGSDAKNTRGSVDCLQHQLWRTAALENLIDDHLIIFSVPPPQGACIPHGTVRIGHKF
eukprot:COSAG02_NODE_5235_length_4517_cov_3.028067_4_plen_63_part_00